MATDFVLRLVVTDTGVHPVPDPDDTARVAEIVRDSVAYGGAKVVEIRDIVLSVDLPSTPVLADAEVREELRVPQDIRDVLEEEMRRRRISDRNTMWDVLMEALPPGRFEVYREPGMRGFRRLD